MAKDIRVRRVGDAVKRLFSEILRTEIQDPRVPAFTTVTEVQMSHDLSFAHCFVSIPAATQEEKKQALEALNKAKGLFRKAMGREIRLMKTPDLSFKLDDSLDQGLKIDALLDEIQKQRVKRADEILEITDED